MTDDGEIPAPEGAGGRVEARRPRPATAPTHRRNALIALMLAMGLAAMDSTIIATAVPRVVSDLGSFSYFSWLFAGYLLAAAVTLPVYGNLADARGRRPVLAFGMLLYLTSSLACALAWNMISLIAFRVAQGLGAGAIQGTVQTIASDLYSPEERGKAQAGLSAVWVSASLLGPALGGIITTYASWRWIFLVNLPIGAVALFLVLRYIRDTGVPTPRTALRVDWAGALGLFASGGLLLFFFVQGGTAWPWFSAPSRITLCGVVVCTAGTVWIETHATQPIIPRWVWKRRVLVSGNIALGALGVVATAPAVILPTYAQSVLGLSPVGAGFILAALMVTWPAAAAFSNRAYLRLGFRNTALAGTACASAVLLAIAMLTFRPPIWQLLLLLVLLGIALGFYQPPVIVGVQSTVLWQERATATSSILFCRQLGQSAGAAIFGAIANAVLSSRLATAPKGLKSGLPRSLDKISSALLNDKRRSPLAVSYLRHAIYSITDRDFEVAAAAGALAFLALLLIAPRRFPAPGPAAVPPLHDRSPAR